MNKYIAQLIMLLSIPTIMFGQLSAKYNAVTTDCAKITGNYSDFRWKWAGYDSQTNNFWILDRGATSDLSATTVAFKMVRLTETGNVTYVSWTNVVVLTNRLSFVIPYTNVPPNGDYMCEVWSASSGSNITRTLSQGRITVFESLYRDDDATYPWPSGTNLAAYTLNTTFNAHATNVGVNVHGLGSASTNNSTDFYLASNPSAFTNQSVTNAHAQLTGSSVHGLGTMSTATETDYLAKAGGGMSGNIDVNGYGLTANDTNSINITTVGSPDAVGLSIYGTNYAGSINAGDVRINLDDSIGEFVISRDGVYKFVFTQAGNFNFDTAKTVSLGYLDIYQDAVSGFQGVNYQTMTGHLTTIGVVTNNGSASLSSAFKTSTNAISSVTEYVTDADVDEKIRLATAESVLYGSTNVAMSPWSAGLRFETNQVTAWTNTFVLTNNAERLVGIRVYTNSIPTIQAGAYVHNINCNYDSAGNTPVVTYRSDVCLWDGATVTNCIILGSSASVLPSVTEVDSAGFLATNATASGNLRLAVFRYALYTRASGSTTCNLNIYGGYNHGTPPVVRNTRLLMPNLNGSSGDNLGNHTATMNLNIGGNSTTNISTIGFTATGFTNYLEGIIQLNGTNYSYVSFYTNATSARTNLTALQ